MVLLEVSVESFLEVSVLLFVVVEFLEESDVELLTLTVLVVVGVVRAVMQERTLNSKTAVMITTTRANTVAMVRPVSEK